MPKIFCIIPAFNEERTISEVIDQVIPYVDEVVVVDDCSADRTFSLASNKNISVLKHIVNRDQGAALQTGNEYALINGADIIVHFDADGQFVAKEIENITKPIIEEKYDIVFGSRFLEKKSNIPWFKKNIIMPIAKIVNLLFFNIRLTDPQSGFRAMTKESAQKIKIENDGKAHCSEILHKTFKNNLKVKEVPITVIYNEFGQKIGGGVRIVKDIILKKIIK